MVLSNDIYIAYIYIHIFFFFLFSGLCLLFYFLFFFFFVLMKLLNYMCVSVAFPLWQQAGTLYHLDFFLFHFVKISAKCVILC